MNVRKIASVFACLVLASASAFAQVDKSEVRKGNRHFRKENYKEADIDYRRALVKDSLSFAANYNLASNLYKMNAAEASQSAIMQAGERLEKIAPMVEGSGHEADFYYNEGNVAIAAKNWQKAVDSFKKSLLVNPDDVDAKENYVYARMMLQNQQDQQNQQNQDNKDNKDQNKDQNQDQNNQDQNDQNKDQQDQNKDQQDKNKDQDQNKDQQNQNGQEPKITPQAAQQMLQAIQAKEAQTQEKVKKEKAAALKSKKKEKNW